MFRSRFLLAAMVAAITTLVAPAPSQATFTLTFQQTGFTQVVITDQSLLDAANGPTQVGMIQYAQNFGNFSTDVTTARSNSADNVSPAVLRFSALSLARLSGVSGGTGLQTLTVTLEDDGFTTPSDLKALWSTLSGSLLSLGGTVTLQNFIDNVGGTQLILTGNGGNPGGTEVRNGPFAGGSPYALKMVLNVTLDVAGQYEGTGRAEVTPTPAPAGLIMLAGALPFAGLLRRRLRKSELATAA